MKVENARSAYLAQLNNTNTQKKAAADASAENEAAKMTGQSKTAVRQDRLDVQRDRMDKLSEKAGEIGALNSELENSEKQCEAMEKGTEEFAKIIEIMRRISRGDKVPMKDEHKLMEYSDKMYQMAKLMAASAHNLKPKKHKSLWEDEDETESVEGAEGAEGAESTAAAAGAPVEAAAEAPVSAELEQMISE